MSPHRLWLVILVLGCQPTDPREPLAQPVVEVLPGGARLVRNPGPSAWADTNGWKLVLERTIAPADGSPGAMSGPRAIVADDSGRVFVLDRKPASIKWYQADGTFGGTIGRQGGGPGEFSDYGWLYLAHDTLVHLDPGQGRMSAFTLGGTFVRSWVGLSRAANDQVADDSGRVPTPVRLADGGINRGQGLIRYRADGTVADSLWYPASPEPKLWSIHTATADMGMFVPFAPYRVEITDRVGRLVWGDQDRYRLVVSLTGKDTLLIIEAVSKAFPIPDSVRQSTFSEAVAKNSWLQPIARLADIPATFPVWTALIADADNNLWVLRAGPHGDGDSFDVFSPTGTWRGSVPAPFHTVDSTFWTHDHVYVLDDSGDGPVIKVFRIVRDDPKTK